MNSDVGAPPAHAADRSVLDQLRVQEEHGKPISLAKALLGEQLDARGGAVVEPRVRVALLDLGQLTGLEPMTTGDRVGRYELTNPSFDPWQIGIAIESRQPASP